MSELSAKERRAKQTINNLLLSILATVGVVIAVVLMVPRDESSRIPKIDYVAVATQAASSSKNNIVVPEIPNGWWSNQAKWLANPIDAVPRFEAGFVGAKNEYIGYTQAFGVNPTWLALSLKDVVLEKNYSENWAIYRSPVVHNPAKTKDLIWVGTFGKDAVLLYGTAPESNFESFSKSIEQKLKG
ncbi:MAG: hypothetical protein RIS26_300 [Actinomycetota bacterium]